MSKAKILLVEDEKNFGVVMRDYLRMNDYEVDLAEDGTKGLSLFEGGSYHICITDVMMPLMDGFTMVSEIRRSNPHIPVLFLTARSMKEDVLRGYKTGADDYIIKPFDSDLLLAKLEAILKRTPFFNKKETTEFQFSDFEYKHPLRTLTHTSGKEVKLSPKESELLWELLSNKNNVISKSELLKRIWKSDNYFSGRSMDVYITKLRKHLDPDPNVNIENVHGSGYGLFLK